MISFAPFIERKATATPTSSIDTRLRAGAFACAFVMSSSKSVMPDAARVFSGPRIADKIPSHGGQRFSMVWEK